MSPSNHGHAPVSTHATHDLTRALRVRLVGVALAATVGAAAIFGVSGQAAHATAGTSAHQMAAISQSVGTGGGPGVP
jgi:hypothetical protein